MANYYGVTRTNYFAVTNETEFREIIARYFNSRLSIFERTQPDGSKQFGFGCYSSFDGLIAEDDDAEDIDGTDSLYCELQEVLQEGHSIIIFEAGHEKLRYVIGSAIVITKTDVQFVDLHDLALKLARRMLDDEHYAPVMDY